MSSKPNEVVLYDLRSKAPNECWSSNTWKVRLILNYKGIPYRTEWIEYADVEGSIKPLGVSPNPEPPAYTVPTAVFPDGKAVMDSAAIAAELERRHPTPAVSGIPSHSHAAAVPDSELAEWTTLHRNAAMQLGKFLMAGSALEISEASRPKKLAEFGGEGALEEFEKNRAQYLQQAAKDGEGPWKELSAFWDRHGDPVIKEGKLTWVAVYQIGVLQYVKRAAPDIWQRMNTIEGATKLRELDDAAEKWGWLARKDY